MISNKKHNNVVILFAKRPELGKVKTRIAEETSDKFAYEFTIACMTDLLDKINNSDYYDLIIAADALDDLSWFQKKFSLEGLVPNKQRDKSSLESQSSKFEKIFTILFDRYKYKKAALIPMDIPFISEEDLISVFARLEQKKFVHGPEINGGVYLIGIRAPFKKEIFKNVRWSTSSSYEDLMSNCGIENTYSLKLKNDLNIPEDILKLRDEIYHNCPVLFDFLNKHNYYFSIKDKYINFDDLSICIPVVSNIVQKKDGKAGVKILIQTRYKPSTDPDNTGKIEIPSGLIKKYELAQEAVVRETKEETGVISKVSDHYQKIIKTKQKNNNIIVLYNPFYCQQQLKGDRAYISLVFISDYVGGKLRENIIENRNPRWASLEEIKTMVKDGPDRIFGLTLSALKEYIKMNLK